MAQEIRYKLLNLELPHGLLGSTIDNLASLPATKHVDQRGRQAWVYYETVQIGRYTDVLLKMDSSINDIIRDRGLEVCPIEKGPRVVRTGDGPEDFHVASSSHIVILTPMTHENTQIQVAGVGEPFSTERVVTAGKQDCLMIYPETKFRLRVPYYMMDRTVRKV